VNEGRVTGEDDSCMRGAMQRTSRKLLGMTTMMDFISVDHVKETSMQSCRKL
jgi:hypothetical protein